MTCIGFDVAIEHLPDGRWVCIIRAAGEAVYEGSEWGSWEIAQGEAESVIEEWLNRI